MNSPQETSTVGSSKKITVSQILCTPVPPPIGLKGNYLIFFFLLIKTKFKQILERNYLYILHYIWTRIFFPYNTVLYCDVHFKNKGLKYVLVFFFFFDIQSRKFLFSSWYASKRTQWTHMRTRLFIELSGILGLLPS